MKKVDNYKCSNLTMNLHRKTGKKTADDVFLLGRDNVGLR